MPCEHVLVPRWFMGQNKHRDYMGDHWLLLPHQYIQRNITRRLASKATQCETHMQQIDIISSSSTSNPIFFLRCLSLIMNNFDFFLMSLLSLYVDATSTAFLSSIYKRPRFSTDMVLLRINPRPDLRGCGGNILCKKQPKKFLCASCAGRAIVCSRRFRYHTHAYCRKKHELRLHLHSQLTSWTSKQNHRASLCVWLARVDQVTFHGDTDTFMIYVLRVTKHGFRSHLH